MPATSKLFAAILKFDQQELPQLLKEIDNGHPTANTKDRLRDLHRMIAVVVRYIVMEDAEKHGLNLGQNPAAVPGPNQAIAQLPVQHFPASAQMSLGAPPMPPRHANVLVGAEPTIAQTIPASAQEEADPERGDGIQIVTKRNGTTVVIPPASSRAPNKTFPAGQGVDATYIAKYDAEQGPVDMSDPASI